MLRFLTAGESHGLALLAILEGMPAGLKIEAGRINSELGRRQLGLGRGERMRIEKDKAEIISGLKKGVTLGSPIGLLIKNKDASIERLPQISCPRPGHADLAGLLKYDFSDARCVLERASARETAARVGIGAICKLFLREFKIGVTSKVICIGGEERLAGMERRVAQAKDSKDTVGGIFEVKAEGVPCGLGSYAQYDRRLDARLAQAVISIPGIKALGFGLGFGYAYRFGSSCHDAIYYNKHKGYFRQTNNAGGIEGGVSNGETIILRACMKPISTLLEPLASVNIKSKKQGKATVERSDICAVEAAGVVAESMCAYVLACAVLEKFGADAMQDIKGNYRNYLKRLR